MAVAVPRPESHHPLATPLPPAAWLVVWSGLALALQLSVWLTGTRDRTIGTAVEAGVAMTESRMTGEFDEDAIRKAIRLQHDSFVFWRALFAISDLCAGPALLVLRSFAIAAAVAGAAAMTGRTPRFTEAWGWASFAQGFWLLGPLLSWTAGMFGWQEFETTARLLLTPGEVLGPVWVAAGNLDPFATIGWCLVAIAVVRFGWAHFTTAWSLLALLALLELISVSAIEMTVQAAMRGTVMP